jgi:PAS domain S-box-containing protein
MGPRSRAPLAIVAVYFLFGVAWILCSDLFFLRFLRTGPEIVRLEVFKGIAYITLTAAGLYWLVRFHVRKLLDMHAVLEDRNRELQDAMDAIREEKARYEAMIMALGDGVSVQDREFRIIYQNRVLKDLYGNQEGTHCFMSYEGSAAVCDGCPLQAAFTDGEVHHAERSARVNDVVHYAELTASPVRDARGEIVAGIEIVRDITDRKNMEERLAASERKFRMLFDHAPDAIFIHAPDGRILEANSAAVDKFGYSHDRLMAMSAHDMESPFHPGRSQQRIRAILAQGSRIFETGLVAENGIVIPVESSSRLISFEGDDAILSYCRDISERRKAEESLRESEERWQFALEGSGDGVWDWDIVSGTVFYSERWKSMLGFGTGDFPETENLWHRLVHPDDRQWVSEELKRHLRADTPVYMTEHRLRCKDGSWKWILDRGKVMARDADGAPLRMVGTYTDITDRKRLEEQLRQAQKMEAVGELAGGIAHDFNNILTAIIGRIYLLQTKLSDREDLLNHADQIAYAAERAANLTQSLLAFSREQIIDLKRIDLNETVKKSGKLFSKLVREDVELTMTLATSKPVVLADEVQIEQILMNLVANARDALPEGGRLMISTDTAWFDEKFVITHGYGRVGAYGVLTVSDNGTGMDEKTRTRIFEPFFTTKEVGRGTGLGLSIVYGIVKQHNGHINVYSEPGSGTTFRIYLPAVDGDVVQEEQVETPAPHYGRGTVLLAEDEDTVRTLTRTILSEFGYQVIEAENGIEAVVKFRENMDRIDAVLLDVIMPRMNGKEARDEILKVRPDAKILFMSGYTGDILGQQGLLSDETGLIQKPLKPRDLLIKLGKLLG